MSGSGGGWQSRVNAVRERIAHDFLRAQVLDRRQIQPAGYEIPVIQYLSDSRASFSITTYSTAGITERICEDPAFRQYGQVEIQIPRDRNGSFEPKIIDKYSRNADDMEEKILSFYACGMSQRDIAEQLKELYDMGIFPELVAKITEKIMPEVTARHTCPRASVQSTTTAQQRHLERSRIGLWRAMYLNSCLQRCVVHQSCSSTRFVSWKDIKLVAADLKRIYTSVTLNEVEDWMALSGFAA